MIHDRLRFLAILILALIVSGCARPGRMQWWRDDKFGLFIHWGPVSLKGTEIGWSRAGERRGRKDKDSGTIPVDVYDNLYKEFNPTRFNADEWVGIARAAGMKYLVFTTKHHDGFCEFDSKLTDYKITNSPFHRDVLADLAKACHRNGLRLGFYYSPPDWHHPDYRTADHAKYIEYMHGQIRELLSNYGKVDVLWFDGLKGTATDWDSENLFAMIHKLQPDIIVNNRGGLPGDYDTPEKKIGAFRTDRAWETCMTLGTQWAWKPDDQIKSLKDCIHILVRTVGGDGNLLLNVGPMPDGRIEPRQVERLKEIGEWLSRYGESIYRTRGGPFRPGPWGASTYRGNAIYVHILAWEGHTVRLPAIEKRILSGRVVTGGVGIIDQGDDGIEITVPPAFRNESDTIVMLALDGPAADARPAVPPATEPPAYSTSASSPMAVIDDGSDKQYINSMCVTQTGAWLVSVTAGHAEKALSYTRRSTDRGRTWEPRVVAYDGKDAGPKHCSEMGQLFPVPQPLGPGGKYRIYQFHILRDTTAGARFGRLVFTISEDDGQTWTGPRGPNSVYTVETPSYALAPNRNGWHLMAPPLVMSSGEFLLPMNVSTDPAALSEIRSELVFAVSRNIFTERDPTRVKFQFFPKPPHGVTAELRNVPGASLAQEPQVVELSDKRLMCVMRTGNGCMYYTVSENHGRTWQPTEPLRDRPGGDILPHPNAPCPFTRLSKGRYALLYCNNDGTAFGGKDPFDNTKNRQPIYIAIGHELAPGPGQPLAFTAPRLLCDIDGFHPEIKWRDLTYGYFLESEGEYYHFYNAVWHFIQVNQVAPALTTAE
jgi:alpha-L-fucosidase